MKKVWSIIKERWQAKMPKFFKWVLGIALSISSVALAINTALISGNAVIPEWWNTIYPYCIGMGAGMAAVAKLTKKTII